MEKFTIPRTSYYIGHPFAKESEERVDTPTLVEGTVHVRGTKKSICALLEIKSQWESINYPFVMIDVENISEKYRHTKDTTIISESLPFYAVSPTQFVENIEELFDIMSDIVNELNAIVRPMNLLSCQNLIDVMDTNWLILEQFPLTMRFEYTEYNGITYHADVAHKISWIHGELPEIMHTPIYHKLCAIDAQTYWEKLREPYYDYSTFTTLTLWNNTLLDWKELLSFTTLADRVDLNELGLTKRWENPVPDWVYDLGKELDEIRTAYPDNTEMYRSFEDWFNDNTVQEKLRKVLQVNN